MPQPPDATPSSTSSEPNPNVEAARLADQLDRAFHGGAWHGPAVAEAIDPVDAELAGRRSTAGSHSILELVLHIAVWADVARRRIDGEPVGAVPDDESWPRPDGADDPEAAWRAARERLAESHRRLHATVAALPDARLDDPVAGSDPTVRGLLLGVLQHHAYHAGQIVLLAKLAGGAG